MERKLGLYVTLGNDGSLKRTLVSISGETELEATTLNDEVILFSELIFDFYAFIVDRIRLSAAYLVTQDGDGKDTVDMRVFEFIQDISFILEIPLSFSFHGTGNPTLRFQDLSHHIKLSSKHANRHHPEKHLHIFCSLGAIDHHLRIRNNTAELAQQCLTNT